MRTERVTAMTFVIVLAAACATVPTLLTGPQMPPEIRQGRSAFVLQPVESDVTDGEIVATVSALIASAPICVRTPALWLEGPARLSAFTVRFDLMARDWGAEATDDARRRMNALVEMGLLSAAPGDGPVIFAITPLGRSMMRGSFGAGRPPGFCGSSEQHLVRVVSTERGAFSCGSLRVHFVHSADQWPAWATSEAARRVVADAGLAPGQSGEGSVSLSRRWYAPETLPQNIPNGSLGSLCQMGRDRYRGDDFNLGGSSTEAEPLDRPEAPAEGPHP
jgi:hypothetical protein